MLFFADTYALVDFVKGNQNYKKYFLQHGIVTTKLNLLELYHLTLKNDSEARAEEYFQTFLPKTTEIEDEMLRKAAQFKISHRKQNISYIDAIGYEISKAKKIRFLTGDMEFKGMPNVEFVK